MEFTKQEIEAIVPSLRRYFKEELEHEISEMQTKFLLNYFIKEIAPFAYNKGVKDAEQYFRGRVEELTSVCFEEGLRYWHQKRK